VIACGMDQPDLARPAWYAGIARPSPLPALTRAQARALDRIAVDEFHLPTIVLMEHAAIALADAVLETCRRLDTTGVLIAVGPGSNGGDGLAAARLIHNAGVDVLIAMLAPPTTGDALTQWKIVQAMGLRAVPWRQAAGDDMLERPPLVILDAVFGTGLSRAPEGEAASFIGLLNTLHQSSPLNYVIAADIPSGLDADTGEPIGPTVIAGRTITFAAPKLGFTNPGAAHYTGQVTVADLGIPAEILDRVARE